MQLLSRPLRQPTSSRSFPLRRAAVMFRAVVISLVLAAGLSGCATNPATGQRQLSLYSEAQEVQMGRDAHQQILSQYGAVEDEELGRYVSRVGQELAAGSERPDLPWTFSVLDDPIVNAFALPGGFIYLTRGILAHFGSEAEMAAVLGHEIGHVTARHGINRMSKAQLAQLGLGVGMIVEPELRGALGDLAQVGMQLLFLKYSRDDERQADELGFRYVKGNYHPAAFVDVFRTLERAGGGGGDRLPAFLTTHPAPADRLETAERRVQGLPAEGLDKPWHRPRYLDQLDGMVFGYDPRQGFFRGRTFYHPDLRLEIVLPEGWRGYNQPQALVAVSPEKDAIFQLTIAGEESIDAAARAFYGQQGLDVRDSWRADRGGFQIEAARLFVANAESPNPLYGAAGFTRFEGRTYRLLGVTTDDAWQRHRNVLRDAMQSFRELRSSKYLRVDPMRLDLVRIDRAMTIEEFHRRYPSDIELDRLAVVNQVELGEEIPAGRTLKRVRGFDPGPMTDVELR